MFILIAGNVVDGIIPIGPFETQKETAEYAIEHIKGTDWHVIPLKPKECSDAYSSTRVPAFKDKWDPEQNAADEREAESLG